MRNIKLVIQYDGTAYHGWQRQKNALGIQEVLEDTLAVVTGEQVNITAAGRTDAGVHACGQVANVRTSCSIPVENLPRALNGLLPSDIAVREAALVPPEFHARYDAVGKMYRYCIYNGEQKSAFWSRYAWHIRGPLSVATMKEAGSAFVGTRDFSAFMATGRPVKTAVRTISGFDCRVVKETDTDRIIELVFKGDGFLYKQVRIMVGTLVALGRGEIPPDEVDEILASGKRERAGQTAPPQGLFLEKVYY